MTETPQGRNRRADRHTRPEEGAARNTGRSRQPRGLTRSKEHSGSPWG